MARKNIESLYDILFNMRSNMETIVQDANTLLNDVSEYGGELNRVIKEQLTKYFIPGLENLIKNEQTPGSIIGLIRFMDSLPLAMTRVEPQVENVAPVMPANAKIEAPAATSAVDNLPANASYQNPVPQETPVQESKKKVNNSKKLNEYGSRWDDLEYTTRGIEYDLENKSFLIWLEKNRRDAYEAFKAIGFNEKEASNVPPYLPETDDEDWDPNKNLSLYDELCDVYSEWKYDEYQDFLDDQANDRYDELFDEAVENVPTITKYEVVRTSGVGSNLGDDVANLEDQVVYEFDNEEEANDKADELNATVLDGEKELLGTEYKVVKKDFTVELDESKMRESSLFDKIIETVCDLIEDHGEDMPGNSFYDKACYVLETGEVDNYMDDDLDDDIISSVEEYLKETGFCE